jgi:AraC-like DNA-binding protein
MLVMIGKRNLGDAFVTQAVHFRHAAPARIDNHRRIFGGTLRFAQPRDELILDRQLLAQPLPQAEPELAELLDRHLAQLISALPQGPGFLDRVRSCVAQELRHGEPSLQDVAQRLHMSGRSLQRRLQQEGTTLQELLAGVRRDLAVRHLHDAQESIAEIAFLLGFSEVSTFHRAFKRWTGLTPSAYRRRSVEKAAR